MRDKLCVYYWFKCNRGQDGLLYLGWISKTYYLDNTPPYPVKFDLMPVYKEKGDIILFGYMDTKGHMVIPYKYLKTYYIVTNETAYISNGDSKKGIMTIPFKEMAIVETHEGLFDKMLGVGDVEISSKKPNVNELEKVSISSIPNFNELCNYISTQKPEESSDSAFEW